MAVQNVFKRVEKKYMLNQQQYQSIVDGISMYMSVDKYGETTICNLYFDSEHDQLIIESIQKPLYKEKFRIRSYGIATDNSKVFLEIKKKFKGVVYKRRIAMNINDVDDYLNKGVVPEQINNITNEISFMLNKYKLIPKLYLAYDRIAYVGNEDKNLRLTIDKNIRSRYHNLTLKSDEQCQLLLPENTYIMEIKIPCAMPLWMCRLLSENGVFPTSFSKYGRIHQKHITEETECSTV